MKDIDCKLIALISHALGIGGDYPDIGSIDDAEKIFSLAERLDVAHLCASAALGCKNYAWLADFRPSLEKRVYEAVIRCERQKIALESLGKLFESEKIGFIPLKGSVIRGFYPEGWMRTGCDIDILVKEDLVDRAAGLMQDTLGYTFIEKGDHDISLRAKNGVKVELHYKLIEGRFMSSEALGGVWETAVKKDGREYEYELSDEIFYVYHIAHAAKHYEEGGCGIKPVIDLFFMLRSGRFRPEKYNDLLGRCSLVKFESLLRSLTAVFFDGKEPGEVERRVAEYLIHSGTFGTMKNGVAIAQLRTGGKKGYALERIFVSYDKLIYHYPVLRKHAWLYPFCQVRRWFRLLFNGSVKSSVNELKLNSSLDGETSERVKTLMDDAGLL